MGLMDLVDRVTGQDAEKIRAVERALVVVSEFTNTSSQHMALYTFTEKSGIALALGLRLHYKKFVVLSGVNADSEDFTDTLKALGKDRKIEAIDVMTHMHGNPDRMYFNDTKNTNQLRDEIRRLKIGDKLRMYYTTACYGATHAKDMVDAGFTCAAGAKGVNTNSATEYPEFLSRWMGHDSFGDCVDKSYNALVTKVFDNKARKMGFDDVDSRKEIHGKRGTTIITPP